MTAWKDATASRPRRSSTNSSRALEAISRYNPTQIATLGGGRSVSVAPFAALVRPYGEDLAIVWIDSHPDIDTPQSRYPGYHAMAVAALTGHGDADMHALLPATASQLIG